MDTILGSDGLYNKKLWKNKMDVKIIYLLQNFPKKSSLNV